ncbi:MAG TPA: Crp/Fnr family transcriptional regulator [Chitinophagales bacterium]|nr:Crp/Fnr family transcriptional regulator [Chitinophagales bacterium]
MKAERVSCLDCVVRHCTVLKNCAPELLSQINSKRSRLLFRKGQPIASSRMYFSGVYVLSSGIAKIYRSGPKGRQFIFRLIKEGDLFGYRMNSEEPGQHLAVDAVEDCEVCYIEKNDFEKAVNESPEVRQQLLIFYHTELFELLSRTCHLMQMNVRERIADTLLYIFRTYQQYQKGRQEIRISLGRQDIADLAGTTKEQVSRTITEFKSLGIIRASGKSLGMTAPETLRAIAGYGWND